MSGSGRADWETNTKGARQRGGHTHTHTHLQRGRWSDARVRRSVHEAAVPPLVPAIRPLRRFVHLVFATRRVADAVRSSDVKSLMIPARMRD